MARDAGHIEELIAGLERQGYTPTRHKARRAVLPPLGCVPELLRGGLALMMARGAEFTIYDPLYPSPTDPGAYFSYSPGRGRWRMTLGNHGWTGGIYELDEDAVLAQLFNLHRKKLLAEITLERVGFFSHYEPERLEKNADMRRTLLALHL